MSTVGQRRGRHEERNSASKATTGIENVIVRGKSWERADKMKKGKGDVHNVSENEENRIRIGEMYSILADASKATIRQLGQEMGKKHDKHAVVFGAQAGVTCDVSSRHVVSGVVEKRPRGHGQPNIVIPRFANEKNPAFRIEAELSIFALEIPIGLFQIEMEGVVVVNVNVWGSCP
jgi:hypothetical protein